MKPEELGRMDSQKELVMIYGEQPLMDDKYIYLDHPAYVQTNDYASDCGLPNCLMFDESTYPVLKTPQLTHKAELHSAIPSVKAMSIDTWKEVFNVKSVDELDTAVEKVLDQFSFENSTAVAWN